MLPSRPRLQSWDPGSLTSTGAGIGTSGVAVDDTVAGIQRGVQNMPEAKVWQGEAHDAAQGMFDRAAMKAGAFSDYATAVATAVSNGAEPIGNARTSLLTKADEIDSGGELYVDDRWVVLITPAAMTAEEAAALEKRAQAAQITVNGLLIKVGAADDDTADAVEACAKEYGYVTPAAGPMEVLTGMRPRPGDEVPNPFSTVGTMQQAMIRDQDMAMTVRESTTQTTGDVKTTTLKMMDGTTHVITEDSAFRLDKGTIVSDALYDKDGKVVYTVSSFQYKDNGQNLAGTKVTEVQFEDGTYAHMLDHGGGAITSLVRTPDGGTGVLPDEFFTDPIPTLAGGVMSGLVKQADSGIPMLSAGLSEKVGTGAKWGGPGLGLAVAAYHTLTAPTAYEKCVAAVSGGAAVGGGFIADATLGLFAPHASPFLAVPVNMLGAWAFGYGGAIIGNVACPQ